MSDHSHAYELAIFYQYDGIGFEVFYALVGKYRVQHLVFWLESILSTPSRSNVSCL